MRAEPNRIWALPIDLSAGMYIYTLVVAGKVLAGSDVTSQIPQGPVVIQNGNVNIHGTNGVKLKNNFKIKVGASLNITTDN